MADDHPHRRPSDPIRELRAAHEVVLAPGDALGPYRVVRRVGEGASAVIFEVERADGEVLPQPATTETVRWAAKVLRPTVLEHAFVREKFEAETRILTQLDHPNIVRVVDSVRHERLSACIMRLVEGSTLEAYIPLHPGGLSEVLALSIGLQVVDAMTYAHAAGFVHRDLKPSNILLEQQPGGTLRAIVADFGLAKILGDASKTRTGVRIGTIAYMAPEQIQDASRVDGRADIYALGITLYECLTGALPFPYRSVYEVIQAQVSRDVPSVRSLRPDLGQKWDRVIARACAKRPEQRYASADGLLADLHALAVELGLIDRNTVALEPVRVSDHGAPGASSSSAGLGAAASSYESLSRGQTSPGMPVHAEPPPERRTLIAPGPLISGFATGDDDRDDAVTAHDSIISESQVAAPMTLQASMSQLGAVARRAPGEASEPGPRAERREAETIDAAELVDAIGSGTGGNAAEGDDDFATAETPPQPLEPLAAGEPTAAAIAATATLEELPRELVRAAATPPAPESHRERALALVDESGPSRATVIGLLLVLGLGLAALAVGLYLATR